MTSHRDVFLSRETMTTYPQFSPSDLPDGTQSRMTFDDSSFFRDHGADRILPSPAEVRARPALTDPRKFSRPMPVIFEELNLIVKFGERVHTTEAVCLWAVRKFLRDQVPVPEVYGWEKDGQDVFIYMQLIRGPTLLERYDSLRREDKLSICQDLRMMLSHLRSMKQSPFNQFIGTIAHGPLIDRVLVYQPKAGPFPSVEAFHDWFSGLWRRHFPELEEMPDPWRKSLPDDGRIVFTHSDLHRSNIIISRTTPGRVLAIIDWEQAGWFPEYWEYCKAMYSVGDWEDWRGNGWISSFLTPYLECKETWDSICDAYGG